MCHPPWRCSPAVGASRTCLCREMGLSGVRVGQFYFTSLPMQPASYFTIWCHHTRGRRAARPFSLSSFVAALSALYFWDLTSDVLAGAFTHTFHNVMKCSSPYYCCMYVSHERTRSGNQSVQAAPVPDIYDVIEAENTAMERVPKAKPRDIANSTPTHSSNHSIIGRGILKRGKSRRPGSEVRAGFSDVKSVSR